MKKSVINLTQSGNSARSRARSSTRKSGNVKTGGRFFTEYGVYHRKDCRSLAGRYRNGKQSDYLEIKS